MAYRANPFLERMSERTSDQEFVRLFSPKIFDRLDDGAFAGAVHLFTSPPGGGKTTLLRAFTPNALRAFWNSRATQDETYQRLQSLEAVHEVEGPQLLGVLLSCASGYADLPPGASIEQAGLFRALLDCRVVLRALRNLASLLGYVTTDQLTDVRVEYDSDLSRDLQAIPLYDSPMALVRWAEEKERAVYAKLDSLAGNAIGTLPLHVRFESVLWLKSVRFLRGNKIVAPRRLLMIDDLQKLRKKQRSQLMEELVELRPPVPVWLAERSIALGEELISQGAREGRDLLHYPLEEMWNGPRGTHQFASFAQSILDRRLDVQRIIPAGSFSQYLEDKLYPDDLHEGFSKAVQAFNQMAEKYRQNIRYVDWLARTQQTTEITNFENLIEIYVTQILIARAEGRRQLTLDLTPLPAEAIDDGDSKVFGAAEIFTHEELKIPYYYGIERLCGLATTNVEELLTIAASLYEGMQAKQVIRKQADPRLSPAEQEKRIKEVARRKRDFIPKNHTEGNRAQNLLDSIGSFCREKTFQISASYAPGVTGVRLSRWELKKIQLDNASASEQYKLLGRVLSECVAENLLTTRSSSASAAREEGLVFYLNRTLCVYHDLPLNYGGWQDVSSEILISWMNRTAALGKRISLELPQ